MRFQDTSGFQAVSAEMLLKGRSDLTVLAPHPDDETLGCGNLLVEASALGVKCRIICVTDGTKSHPSSTRWPRAALAQLRQEELAKAAAVLGSVQVHHMGYPDCEAPTGGKALDDLVKRIPPHSVFLSTWAGDPHIDHQNCAILASSVAQARPDLLHLAYPVWGRASPALPFPQQGWRLVSGGSNDAKAKALACHRSQMTWMIDDDPEGFVMDPALQSLFLTEPEVFLAP